MVVALKPGLAIALALLLAPAAHGQALNDPLKPPAALTTVEAGGAGASAGARLTSILLPEKNGGVARAVIDGQLVKVGERVGDAKLLRLTAQSAVLQGPNGRETLSLTPGVDKKTREDKKAPLRRKDKQ